MFEALREKGIKVCSIEPGMVNTPMVTGDRLDRSKMIQPEDIAHTVVFVAKVPRPPCVSLCVRVVVRCLLNAARNTRNTHSSR
jgi:NADP-dependent 3-hydroxy acid dehydrogenase YdfG